MDDYIYDYHCGILKMFSDYKKHKTDVVFKYDMNHKKYDILKERYPIDVIAGGGSSLQQAINLMRWVNETVCHNGNSDVQPYHSLAILEHSYQKGKDFGVACFCLAIVLNECLLTIGIKARILHLYPANPYDYDSHVVVMAYIKELKKWIMLDPTFNCYCMDKDRNILSPWEIRAFIGEKGSILCNADMRYNGEHQDTEQATQWRKQYYAKNMFCMYSTETNTFNSELFLTKYGYLESQRNVYLCPKGFDPVKFELEKARFCNWGEYHEFINKTKAQRVVIDFEKFIQDPCK